jgi:formate--tetrahydrofolate ligase
LVVTIRALKYHGGASLKELTKEDLTAVRKGLVNMEKHLENIQKFNVKPIVAINKFTSDTKEEIQIVLERCHELGIVAHESDVWGKGGDGTLELAHSVVDICDNNTSTFKPIYSWSDSVEDKIMAVASQIYGAKAIDYTLQAKRDLRKISKLNLEGLPVCIAKTQKSLSDNPKLLGRPKDFVVTVREIEIASGAGFLIPITGDIMRMPGLPATPAAENIDIDNNGVISGLF